MELTKILGLPAVAVVLLLAGCAREDGSADYAAGMAAYDSGDWSTAAACFDRAHRLSPTNSAALFHLASADAELGMFDAADAAVRSALDLDPASRPAICLDGRIAYQLRQYDRAQRDWKLVADDAAAPAQLRAWACSALGALAIVTGDLDGARLALWRGLAIDRGNPQLWYHLGKLYRDSFRFEREALECFETFVRCAAEGDECAARVKERVIPELRASVAQALADAVGSARRDPGKAASAIAEGDKLAGAKKLTLAIKAYERALAADPLSGVAAIRIAETMEKLNPGASGAPKVLAAWKRAAGIPPYPKAAFHGAARTAQRMSRWTESQAILSRALARNPADTTALELLVISCRKAGRPKLADAYSAYLKTLAGR